MVPSGHENKIQTGGSILILFGFSKYWHFHIIIPPKWVSIFSCRIKQRTATKYNKTSSLCNRRDWLKFIACVGSHYVQTILYSITYIGTRPNLYYMRDRTSRAVSHAWFFSSSTIYRARFGTINVIERLGFTCTIFSYGTIHLAPFCTIQKSKLKGPKMAELQYFETGL